ncbi:hypothetical protein BC829DRAFT_381829, partial [Chytridium lagenaria]
MSFFDLFSFTCLLTNLYCIVIYFYLSFFHLLLVVSFHCVVVVMAPIPLVYLPV